MTDLGTTLGVVALCNIDTEMIGRDIKFMEKQNEFFLYTNGCKKDDDSGEEEELSPLGPTAITTACHATEIIQNNIPCRRRVSVLLNTMLTNNY
jgi:hypothetical protein